MKKIVRDTNFTVYFPSIREFYSNKEFCMNSEQGGER